MLKQYQKPMFMIMVAETEDILTLSLNTTNVYGISDDRKTFGFENGEIWANN